ncbi:MAG: SO_0444 family Cu/Zn efflux transporter [Alphaproteobacteria bacterium]|nr:SO_0444 family Cu/Zn efflux transporter [Alphaproteobacteria bacterium]
MDIAVFVENLIHLSLDAAPWLLVGLLLAGLIKAWAPEQGMARLMGGRGLGSVLNGALVGAPLPICSCGVLPAAIGLRRAGASREATTSFLVATPETGVDSVAVSYAMLGPFMAVARPVAAIASAVVTGLMMRFLPPEPAVQTQPSVQGGGSCCTSSCCGGAKPAPAPAKPSAWTRTWGGVHYALFDIFDDLAVWLMVGLVLAAATMTWVPPQTMAEYGGGLFAMVMMVIIGIPMYICATASTPVAAGMLMAGVSPGAAMVFMLAGPATNIATLGVVRKEMGGRAVALYLTGIISSSLVAGLVTDAVASRLGVDMTVQMAAAGEVVPDIVAQASAVFLAALLVRTLLKGVGLGRVFARENAL